MSNSKINQTFGGQPANGNVYNNQSNGVNLEHFLDHTPMTQDSEWYESETEDSKTNNYHDYEINKGETNDYYESTTVDGKTKDDSQFGYEENPPEDNHKDNLQISHGVTPFNFKKTNTNEDEATNEYHNLNTKPKAASTTYRDKIPESLRKPFRDPRLSSNASIVTPMLKKTNNDNPKYNKSSNPAISKPRAQGNPENHSYISHENIHAEDFNFNIQLLETDNIKKNSANTEFAASENTEAKPTQNDPSNNPTTNKNDPTRILFNLKFKPTKLYNSPYLDPAFKPSSDKVNLSPELEPLFPLIMSQHEVFEQHIKDLGNIYLTLTRIIEKKKESFNLLKINKKIPRSLRIKCELTTSPSYANHHSFIQLKEELQNEVSTFIENSSKIMERWAETNIQLLTNDRCTTILTKALQILEGLSSFYADIIGQPYWPSVSIKNITLFLLKIYFSNSYIQTDDLTEHLGLPLEDILLLSAKIIHDAASDSEVKNLISNINILEFDTTDNIQREFVSEVLMNFNQIIRITTIDIWHYNKERTRQSKAAQNLKFKMKSLDTLAVTTATASALSKATESFNNAHTTEAKTNLRISNIEKAIRRQENTTNEIANKIKRTPQKNYSGSHNSELMASPVEQALKLNRKRQNQKLVDLTLDASQESEEEDNTSFQKTLKKESQIKKQKKRKLSPPRKKVQWGEVETRNFNKGQATLSFSSPRFPHHTHFSTTPVSQPPFFTPAPPPTFLPSPYPNQTNIHPNPLFNQGHGIHFTNPLNSQIQGYSQPPGQAQNPFYPSSHQQKQFERSREFPFGK